MLIRRTIRNKDNAIKSCNGVKINLCPISLGKEYIIPESYNIEYSDNNVRRISRTRSVSITERIYSSLNYILNSIDNEKGNVYSAILTDVMYNAVPITQEIISKKHGIKLVIVDTAILPRDESIIVARAKVKGIPIDKSSIKFRSYLYLDYVISVNKETLSLSSYEIDHI